MWNYCASFFISSGKENQNPIVQIKNLIASILIYCCADDQWFTLTYFASIILMDYNLIFKNKWNNSKQACPLVWI